MPDPDHAHKIADSAMQGLLAIAPMEGKLDETIWNSIRKADDCRRKEHRDKRTLDRCCDLSLALLRQLENGLFQKQVSPCFMEGCVLMLQGALLLDLDQFTEAARCFERADQCYRDENSPRSVAVASLALGKLHDLEEQRPEAMTAYRRGYLSLNKLEASDPTTMTLKTSLRQGWDGVVDQFLQPSEASGEARGHASLLGFLSAEAAPGGTVPLGPKGLTLPLEFLPIVGRLEAGKGIAVTDGITGYASTERVSIEGESYSVRPMVKGRRVGPDFSLDYLYFATPVEGSSMNEIDIVEGDYVLLRRPRYGGGDPVPDDGDIVAAVIPGDDRRALLKAFEQLPDGRISLQYEDGSGDSHIFEPDEAPDIAGIAIAILKRTNGD